MGLLKINLLIALFVFLGFSSAPCRANDGDEPTFHVQQVDPSFDSQKMAGPGVKVHSADALNNGDWKIPEAKIRDQIFLKAGLKNDVSSLDDMDKDVLFMTARDSSTKVLVKNYPKIPQTKLLSLARLTKEAAK